MDVFYTESHPLLRLANIGKFSEKTSTVRPRQKEDRGNRGNSKEMTEINCSTQNVGPFVFV